MARIAVAVPVNIVDLIINPADQQSSICELNSRSVADSSAPNREAGRQHKRASKSRFMRTLSWDFRPGWI